MAKRTKENIVYESCKRAGPYSGNGCDIKCAGYHYGCQIGGIAGPNRWHWHKTRAAQKKCPYPTKN